MDFIDFDLVIIDYFVLKGLEGLVVGLFVGGWISVGMVEGLKWVVDNGLLICIVL